MTKLVTVDNLSTEFKLDNRNKKIKLNLNAGDNISFTRNSRGITINASGASSNSFRRIYNGVLRKDDTFYLGESILGKEFLVLVKLSTSDTETRNSGILYAVRDNDIHIIKINSEDSTVEVTLRNNGTELLYSWNSEKSRNSYVITEIYVR